MPLELPADPLIELERNVINTARLLGVAAWSWMDRNPGRLPKLEVILCHREHRQTVESIEKLRLGRARQRLAERIAVAQLPQIADEQITVEVDRLVAERLSLLSGDDLFALAEQRRAEERLMIVPVVEGGDE